ncbi:hypothetical protein, partial [Neisseria musculi]|uniref:hypothetical protein n=1 Tax=Neisseria musculi TaxID=1815583 RepID=UPI00360DBBA1
LDCCRKNTSTALTLSHTIFGCFVSGRMPSVARFGKTLFHFCNGSAAHQFKGNDAASRPSAAEPLQNRRSSAVSPVLFSACCRCRQ